MLTKLILLLQYKEFCCLVDIKQNEKSTSMCTIGSAFVLNSYQNLISQKIESMLTIDVLVQDIHLILLFYCSSHFITIILNLKLFYVKPKVSSSKVEKKCDLHQAVTMLLQVPFVLMNHYQQCHVPHLTVVR